MALYNVLAIFALIAVAVAQRAPPPPPPVVKTCSVLTGGATSIVNEQINPAGGTAGDLAIGILAKSGLAVDLVSTFSTSTVFKPVMTSAFSGYRAAGSGTGVKFFSNPTLTPHLCTAFSDDPMTSTQENTYGSLFGNGSITAGIRYTTKYTLPIALAGYGFFVNEGKTYDLKTNKTGQYIKLGGVDVFNIYYGGGKGKAGTTYTWAYKLFTSAKDTTVKNTADPAFLASTIKPYSRDSSSGTTQLVKIFFSKALEAAGMKFPTDTILDSAVFPATWMTQQYLGAGTNGICAKLISNVGAIGYSQRAVCGNTQYLTEVALKNAAGSYIQSFSVDLSTSVSQAVLQGLPADAAWNTVSLVYQTGAATPPIASFVYFLIKKRYTLAQAPVVSNFAKFMTFNVGQYISTKVTASGLIIPNKDITNLAYAAASKVAGV